ncbi:hypothetical protein [Aestuariivita sp.]|jgi:hypothetical protein|uniref:hypothetical protein n=1 Tax=Aestuariivita sp. TaxID=1872407 RepID=UPI0021715F20|nr:hypothetical protein [Aestuariivita sp.]MCE8007113.1 hypothetical protein [Aestuariivita sp.]
MAQNTPPEKPARPGKNREDRLKAALKANLARRKAQARARNTDDSSAEAAKTGKAKG